MKQKLHKLTKKNDWSTPRDLLFKAIQDFNLKPELDVCATRDNHKFKYFITPTENALTKEWNKDFFMNPPYDQVKEFMAYAFEQHKKHNVDALILVNAKVDTKWFNKYVFDQKTKKFIAEFYPIEGRIKFIDNGKVSSNSAPYPSCWIIFRKKNDIQTKKRK